MKFKSGFVTVIGRPNVGKSTLLNKIIGEKISIISDKAQTTRNKIKMIYTDDDSQIIFLDTPGVQMPKNALGEYMLKVSKSTLEDVDLITMLVDAGEAFGKLDSYILDALKDLNTPKILLINKIDIAEDDISELVERYESLGIFKKIIPISALESTNLEKYIEEIKDILPEGPIYFPDDMITDQPERSIIQELIREKVLLNMQDEIPHGIAVEVESIKKRENRDLLDIHAVIYVEKKSHKPMVIGKGGKMIQRIGSESRNDIERLMDTKVNLQLWVKISKDWRSKEERVKSFGYK
ncbi:MAG: GTPase Era [Tissierellia bacterium]|nr:GTPase Era [Tissierellia bacterium]